MKVDIIRCGRQWGTWDEYAQCCFGYNRNIWSGAPSSSLNQSILWVTLISISPVIICLIPLEGYTFGRTLVSWLRICYPYGSFRVIPCQCIILADTLFRIITSSFSALAEVISRYFDLTANSLFLRVLQNKNFSS